MELKMATRLYFHLWLLILIIAALSSFTIVFAAEETSKSEEQADVTTSDDSTSQEDSKEKRSQEEILFGNQQNKPNGLVDDLMSMSESMEDASNGSQVQDSKLDEEDEKKTSNQEENQNDIMMGSGSDSWYNNENSRPGAMQHMAVAASLKNLPIAQLANTLYDQEDLYRRKRQLVDHPLRTLRSSLGQMIQKRGIRMPRRSMRLKRQVDVEDLLNLFGNERYYNEDVSPHSFSGRARTVSKRRVPGRYNGYQEMSEYRYPYVFQHRDNGLLSSKKSEEGNGHNDALDELMLLPPNSRYIDTSQDMDILPYRSQDEEREDIQNWLSRNTVPSVFSVSRRSAPYFYPIDYRYVPGYKKRSEGNRLSDYNEEDPESDFGRWGHVVQVPEAYASPEDIARLYGLANLMNEGDEVRMRRST